MSASFQIDHYDFHGFFRLALHAEGEKARRYFAAEYGDFGAGAAPEPDLSVWVGRCADGAVGDEGSSDWEVFRERHKVATWRLAISGLLAPQTRLAFRGDLFPNMFLQHYIEQIMRFKLSQKGLVLVHAGCVASEGTSVLLPGQGHSGKTALVLQQVLAGWQFQADDYTFVTSTGQTLCFPRRLHISQHTGAACPGSMRKVALQHKILVLAKYLVYLLTLKYGELSEPLRLSEMLPGAEIARNARLGAVILLKCGGPGDVRGPLPVPEAEVVDRVAAINRGEGGRFQRALRRLEDKGGGALVADWWRRERTVLQQALSGIPGYEIVVPQGAARPADTLAEVSRRATTIVG